MSDELDYSGKAWFSYNRAPHINMVVEDFHHYQSPLVDADGDVLGRPRNKIGFDLSGSK